MAKKVDIHFNWVDDEVASINCPYCKQELTINIYKDDPDDNKCECGKRFILHQSNWVEEME